MDPFTIFLVNKHERIGGKCAQENHLSEDGPPVVTLFLTSPAILCVYTSRPHHHTNVKAVSLPYKLFGSHTRWFKFVYTVFLSCIETHVSHVCVRKIMLILI